MKKILALLITVTMVTSAFAQYQSGNRRDNREVVYNDGKYKKDDNRFNDRYAFTVRERDMEIARINREYDQKIREVQHRLFLNRNKKEKLTWQLEAQRRNEIQNVYSRFNDRRNRHYNERPGRY